MVKQTTKGNLDNEKDCNILEDFFLQQHRSTSNLA